MEKKNLIQRLGISVGSFILGVALGTGMNYVSKDQPILQPTQEQTQKVEFNLPYNTGLGWTDPQNQRIYLKTDIDGDGWLDTYYIENPFSRNKFAIRLDAFGKEQLPKNY